MAENGTFGLKGWAAETVGAAEAMICFDGLDPNSVRDIVTLGGLVLAAHYGISPRNVDRALAITWQLPSDPREKNDGSGAIAA